MGKKFLVDSMLGKLGKWMRMVGMDAAPRQEKRFSTFLREGRESGRIILTKDRKFKNIYSPPAFYFVNANSIEEQFVEIIREFNIDANRDFLTRCLLCNCEIEKVERSDVEGLVPDYVYDNYLKFTRCPRCSKIYWEGTHVANLRKRILKALDYQKR